VKSANHRNIGYVRFCIFPIVFFTVMLVIALIFGWSEWNKGTPLLLSCLTGAFLGFFITWFPTIIIWRFFLYVTRGVPFRDGQLVKITKGKYRGAKGLIEKRDCQQAMVLVKLHTDADGKSISHSDWFDWLEVCRFKLK
jgi:hypothetical protein